MALTLVVLEGTTAGSDPAGAPAPPASPASDELSLTLDAPRVVVGRGDGCEVRLPDPSVSGRHASVRQRGAEYALVDEGSLNGTFLGRRRLAPHTPEPLRDGDLFRVGRVWLRARVGPAMPRGTPAAAARELALALVARGLAAQGEDPTPRLVVVAGPDEGRALPLAEAGRPYVVGRGKDADLPLEDQAAARRHVTVTRKGDHFLVRDLSGASLDGAPLPQGADVAFRPGQVLALGRTEIACEHPAVEALAELERSPDEPVRPGEVFDPPEVPGAPDADEPEEGEEPPASEAPPESEASAAGPAAPASARVARRARQEPAAPAGGWGLTDAAVVLVALGVLGLSIAGLAWLLGRG